MATQAASPEQFKYRTSPTVTEAFEGWLKDHPQDMPVHTDPWDVSRADIYAEDRWQPIFAEMRAKAPVNQVKDTPYGTYWNVTTVKTIQHVESLPEAVLGVNVQCPDPQNDLFHGASARDTLPLQACHQVRDDVLHQAVFVHGCAFLR